MALEFSGKVALVTGAGSGIGRAIAMQLAVDGATVVVVDISEEGGEETVAQILERGGDSVFRYCDKSDAEQVARLIENVVSEFGRLDFACNNAAIDGIPGPLVDCTLENFDRIMAVNLRGTFLCMKHELKPMLQQGQGVIVNIASTAAKVGTMGLGAYSASKHGVLGLTKTAALEYGSAGIRINAVCPGAVKTQMLKDIISNNPEIEEQMIDAHPIGRIGEPEEIAHTVAWLCSDRSGFILGHGLAVDGGLLAQ